MDHIELNLGNVLMIAGVSITSTLVFLAVVHAASHKNVPVVSPTARGTADFLASATNTQRTAA